MKSKNILTTVKGIENLETLMGLRVWATLSEACPELCNQSVVTFKVNGKEYLALMGWSDFRENL